MNSKQLVVGMCTGLAVGCGTAMMMGNKKKPNKHAVGKALRTLGDMVDSVSSNLGM